MKKKFKLSSIRCAGCAGKMEALINQIDGVKSAKIVFASKKLIIDGEDEKMEQIISLAAEACKKINDDCEIVL